VIAFVEGRVAALGPDAAVVAVGGVGLSVQCTPSTLSRLRVGESARLPTSLVVREESLTLYGFADEDERVIFELLQTASGVGPRLALAMLAVHGPEALRAAVVTEDLAALTAVPGIGRKGAQRIVLELRDRLGGPTAGVPAQGSSAGADTAAWRSQLHAALVNLGWSLREADDAIGTIGAEADAMIQERGAPDIAALLRSALRSLSPT